MSTYKIAINTMSTGKLPQGDPRWGTFNDLFENMELDITEIANYIYLGHAYAGWCDGRRNLDNFILAQHIAVDLDSGDERSDIEALRENEFVRAYGGLIHTTPSHTATAPRCRIIFFLDRPITTATAMGAATTFLIDHFGSDQSCKDASRFFYGSRDCAIALLMNELPVSHLRTYYQRWRKTQPTPRSIPTRNETPYRAPRDAAPKDELAKVQRALERIDPWAIDYDQWVAVLAALHDELGDAALPLAERWASGKPGEIQRKWKSFGSYTGNKAGLGKIYHLAGKE